MSSSGRKRQHEAMMASIYSSIHEDDGIEATVLQGVVATVEEVLESSDEDEEETQ